MKLTKAKQKLLDEAYNTVIQVCLYDRPLEDLTPVLSEDVMNFGAGKNELTKSKAAFLKQIKNQKKLAEGLKMDFAFTPVLRKVMNQGNGAIYTDDIVNTVWVNQIKNELKFRISFIFEYCDGRWLLVHSHTSTPDPQRTDDEVWPIEDLKKRTEFLEKSLDEKMAELQEKNRELEVEAALERVRSKTMAMHNSSDVGATVITLFDEVMKLGIDKSIRCGIGILEGSDLMETWSANYSPSGNVDLKMGMLNMTIHPMLVGLKKAWKSKKKGYTYHFIGKDVLKYYTALNNEPEYPYNADLKTLPVNVYHNSFFYSSGILFAFTENPISKEGAKVLNRFAEVFGQTYRRYLDLQKAEEQAREATIESALERVRASSMAMNKSDQLPETSQVLFEQFAQLGNLPDRISICIIKEEENLIELWATDQIGSQLDHRYRGSLEEATTMSKIHTAWKEGKDSIVIDLSGQRLKDWLRYIKVDVKLPIDDSNIKGRRVQQAAFFSKGLLLCTTNEPVADETMELLVRFAKVFDQTYTRFLDLQNAEAQAREARIEVALERVRSRAMAMHHTDELTDVLGVLFDQFDFLGINPVLTHLTLFDEANETFTLRITTGGKKRVIAEQLIDVNAVESWKTSFANWKKSDLHAVDCIYYPPEILPAVWELLDEVMSALPEEHKIVPEDFPDGFYTTQGHCKYGFLGFNHSRRATEEEKEIVVRFAKEFGRLYQRFLDLKQAQERAKDALKQASLDRVRGQIASMRTAADLERITPLVWNELKVLGVPFIRCGVFIIDETTEIVEVYLSAPDGHSLGVLHLQFNANPLTANMITHWQKGNIYKEHWNREEFLSWTRSLMEEGQISDKNTYQGTANPPESLNLHFTPFTQGMLYVGSENPLINEQIKLVQSLAEAFAIAYARYEDFTKLEKAKQSVETTLTDLKQTQQQLVQSEKMASLGELTAGIAHEIQNPLNFVNNFSEVSVELIEEMHEELEKGDLKEAMAIAEDVKQNLDKITHHGKRADGIVKGMLQHSRSSSGQKELTDINVLADEYLRLAYHGLKAKDKTFNATMKSEFDETIGQINIVPQDIGRVVLNLITNAFYAVSERKLKQPEGYEPTVSVITKKIEDQVLISVKDNGNGIPDSVKKKIFQPFFTTKPTGQGTGLGLSLSYDIVKAHGGELKVQTKEGQGTIFKIQLPVT
jgi:signal transduction histidine kinase